MVVIICGVSGAGKTTVGQLLAQELCWSFHDADDFHPATNIDKMHRGVPLTDEDRQPWLESLRALIKRWLSREENAVLACSVLKKAYRDHLRVSTDVKIVFLRGTYALVAGQLRHRHGHFMDPELLQSQFADLEEPLPAEGAVVVELGRVPSQLVAEIKAELRLGK